MRNERRENEMEHAAKRRMRRVVLVLVVIFAVIFAGRAPADAGGYDICDKKPWKCNTTTTTTEPTTTTTTTGEPSTTTTLAETTTTTTAPSSTTSFPDTSTSTPSTTLPAPTTTAPTDPSIDPVEWSWSSTCDTITVDFGPEILAVALYYPPDYREVVELVPGTYDAAVDAETTFELVPIADGNHYPVPDSVLVTVYPCTPGPTLTFPEEPGDPADPADPVDPLEELPFTGIEDNLGWIALSALALGTILVLAARREQDA